MLDQARLKIPNCGTQGVKAEEAQCGSFEASPEVSDRSQDRYKQN